MACNVQRPGAGAVGSAAAGAGTSGLGPCRRRSCSSSRRLRPTPAVAAVLVGQDPPQAVSLVAGEPGVDGVGGAGLGQAPTGGGVRGEAIGDLQQGGAALADNGVWVMVTVAQQLLPLWFG